MGIQLSDRIENNVGKEEIARYEQFLLFPQCFQKRQNEYLWCKGLIPQLFTHTTPFYISPDLQHFPMTN